MSEFCLDCFNKLFDKKLTEKEVRLSLFKELCEGCTQYKRVVVTVRKRKNFFAD